MNAVTRVLSFPFRKMAEFSFNTVSVEWLARNGYKRLYALLGGGEESWSGLSVNAQTAMNCSVVWACIRAISDPIGFLPLRLYKRIGEDRERATSHPLYSLLRDAPNGDQTALDFKAALQYHLLSFGNAFAEIVRRSGRDEIVGLTPIDPQIVVPNYEDPSQLRYDVIREGKKETWDRSRMFHIRGLGNGLWGYSVITLARQSIGLAMAMEKYGSRFFASGGRVPYVLEHPATFKNKYEADEFRAAWETAYGTTENWHKSVILTGGMKYNQIGMKPEDAQFLASRQFQVPEICRWFRISPHIVGDLSRATFSNIEHLGIEFLTQTLTYWLTAWEQAISRCLLTPVERKSYYAEFDTSSLLRGDYKSRMEGYAIARQNGWLSANDIRRKENENPIEGGDEYIVQLNMQPLQGLADRANQQAANGNGVKKIAHDFIEQPIMVGVKIPQKKLHKRIIRDERGHIIGLEQTEVIDGQ